MDAKLQLIEKELRKLLGYMKTGIANNPCAKFKVLTHLNRIIETYIGTQNLNDFIQEKFPSEYKLLNTKQTKFFIWLLYHYCIENLNFRFILEFFGFLYYIIIINKLLKFCDDKLYNLTLSKLRISHQFRKYGVVDGITRLSDQVYEKFKSQQKHCDDFLFYRNIIYRLRTSISQSCKRLAKVYYQVKSNQETSKDSNIETIVDNIYQHIMFYGYIPKIDKCDDLYDKFKNLPYLDENLVKNSIYEIIQLIYNVPEISHQKIVSNLNKLVYSHEVLHKLNIPIFTRTLLCYVYTIIKIYRG